MKVRGRRFYSPNGCSEQEWTRPKPGACLSLWVSRGWWRSKAAGGSVLAASQVHEQEIELQVEQLELKPAFSWDAGVVDSDFIRYSPAWSLRL